MSLFPTTLPLSCVFRHFARVTFFALRCQRGLLSQALGMYSSGARASAALAFTRYGISADCTGRKKVIYGCSERSLPPRVWGGFTGLQAVPPWRLFYPGQRKKPMGTAARVGFAHVMRKTIGRLLHCYVTFRSQARIKSSFDGF